MTRSIIVSFALAAVLAAPFVCGSANAAEEVPAAPAALSGPQIGSPAPDFALTTVAGKPVSLASFRGKTLVVNVWATWCPPCRQEMPELIETAKKLQSAGVAVLGVDTTEQAPIVRAYVAARNVSYPQAIDSAKTFSSAYDVQYFPTTYVIDPSGVLRARYIDVIASKQLDALVAAADAGKSAVIASPLQSEIDAALAPSRFVFGGDSAANEKAAAAVKAATASAEDLLERSDAASGNSTDLLRTRAEEATIRDAAIAALAGESPPSGSILVAQLRGDAASDREQWQPAIDAYRIVLASDPKNADALNGVSIAAARSKQYPLEVDADAKLAALDPADSSALVTLARAQARAGSLPDAYATFDRALAVAQSAADAHPNVAKDLRALAYAHLYYGRVLQSAGETSRAHEQFDRTLAIATTLPAKDARRDMYIEEGQEALVSLRLGQNGGGATVSVAPWTGRELRGSIPNTIKYRIVVAGHAGKNVTLKASDVPKGWVASFCSDLVCSPFTMALEIPPSGVKIVEMQLVPPDAKDAAPKVRVTSSGDGPESSATT